MKIVVDENIAFAEEAFSEFGSIRLLNGRLINQNDLIDTDFLIVRSITKVDKNLLQNTPVKFVGTATIGADHIDIDYLKKNKISFAVAKGCNADSVVEYVFTALLKTAVEERIHLPEKSIGIIGVGNIGGRVEKLAKELGMKVLKNDPPKERDRIGSSYVSLDKILECDIISLHVPLNKEGRDKTTHLLNNQNIKNIKEKAIIINTARGLVIDNNGLLNEARTKKLKLILDVWENEPNINIDLLKTTKIGTAHIAGYSLEGKANGTKMIYDSLCNYLNKKPVWGPYIENIKNADLQLQAGKSFEETLYKVFSSIYNIETDDKELKWICNLGSKKQGEQFEKIRREYPARREFNNYTITLHRKDLKYKQVLEAFRFKVKT